MHLLVTRFTINLHKTYVKHLQCNMTICEIIVHLLGIVQNKKKRMHVTCIKIVDFLMFILTVYTMTTNL